MKRVTFIFLFFLLTQWTLGQSKTESTFSRYLESEDENLAQTIVKSKDGTYSLYCQAALSEDLNERMNLFTKFIQLNPKLGMAKAYLNRGVIYTMTEKYDSALSDYNKSIELDPKEPYAYYFRGQAYASLEQHDKAITEYGQAIKLQPGLYLAYHMRGISFLSKENYKDALSDFNKVIELRKNYDPAYLMRGLAYENSGDYKSAIADYKEAKKLNKDNTENADARIEKASKKMKEQK